MPKRVIDFDALWASDKLASCVEWAQGEYAWLYGLADASGSFEMTNLRVIWGRVAAIRKTLTLERLQEIFDEFIARGLLFTWEENGKRYGHWTGSDVPGRLPAPSWRARLEKLAPPVPPDGLAAYSARFGGSKESVVRRAAASATPASQRPAPAGADSEARGLKPELESAQAQDWNLGLDSEKDLDLEKEKAACPRQCAQDLMNADAALESGVTSPSREVPPLPKPGTPGFAHTADDLLEIYERERGELPAAGELTPERRRACERWPAQGFSLAEFRQAVRRAATTPFLAGDNARGWRASFDWLIAKRSNVLKVLCGDYDDRRLGARKSSAEKRVLADLYAGAGPQPGHCGVRASQQPRASPAAPS